MSAGGVSIDSRSLEAGDIFFALRGDTHDGHDFVAAALAAGAAQAVVEASQLPRLWRECAAGKDRLVPVEDTLAALQARANATRRAWGGPLVAVTGSAGKTTTKEMIAAVLATHLHVHKSPGNFNNHVGVPLTLLGLKPEHQVAVVEMGMNHAGEIARLAACAAPDVGVFTNVGAAHIGNLGSLEAIAEAKRELARAIAAAAGCVAPGPALVLNAGDARVATFGDGFPGRVEFYRSGGSDRSSANAAAAVSTGTLFGIDAGMASAAIESMPALPGRGRQFQAGGVTFIDDCYNANPEAMAYMLAVLARTAARRRIAVLGEMRELGALSVRLHRELGEVAAAANAGLDALFTIAGDARHVLEAARGAGFAAPGFFFETAAAAAPLLVNFLLPGDAVLFKASRGVRLEAALELVVTHLDARR